VSTFVLVLPEISEPFGRKFAISNRMLDVLVAEIVLQRPRSWSPSVYSCCERSFLDSPVWRPSGIPMHTANERWQAY